ncbi:hypothetical protein [Pseudomonas nunensis]|uniref:hypothetical protein n=1 Tax=Pseudomonas nunensis TaxID=2961896 RepID=UPI0012E2E2AA|nr:hypothetical protein [Pseudomonas nunensis]
MQTNVRAISNADSGTRTSIPVVIVVLTGQNNGTVNVFLPQTPTNNRWKWALPLFRGFAVGALMKIIANFNS